MKYRYIIWEWLRSFMHNYKIGIKMGNDEKEGKKYGIQCFLIKI
jgi:hypothetical protein